MVFSEILLKVPYGFAWNLISKIRDKKIVAFYCHEAIDYEIFRNVHKLLPKIKIIAKSKSLAITLKKRYNIKCSIYPQFPDVIIMARHSLHLFPCKKILKIGMRHGAYHFKSFISAEKYNRFDLFFFTSHKEVEEAKAIGIHNARWGGFPKCDTLFDENYICEAIKLKEQICDPSKKSILFSSTWDSSGLSGVDFWYDKLSEITEKYNVFVTLHPWVSKKITEQIKSTPNVHFINHYDNIYKYILIADAFVADTSSIIAEFMITGKPILTFRLPPKGRLSQDIYDLLERYTFRVNNFQELMQKITNLFTETNKKLDYSECIDIFFSDEIGRHGQVMAIEIRDFLLQKGIEL